jgi:hypothetical protein
VEEEAAEMAAIRGVLLGIGFSALVAGIFLSDVTATRIFLSGTLAVLILIALEVGEIVKNIQGRKAMEEQERTQEVK